MSAGELVQRHPLCLNHFVDSEGMISSFGCPLHLPMIKTLTLMAFFCACLGLAEAQSNNLLVSGNFQTLKPWQANDNLQKAGKVTLLPKEQGVLIHNCGEIIVNCLQPELKRPHDYQHAP
jgi:hypothetical protein